MEADDRDVIHYFHQGLDNNKLWCKMFESNPKMVSEMMAVINKHTDMEDAKKAHRHHKDRRNTDDRPKQRQDDRPHHHGCPPRHSSNKNHDRPESTKSQDRKHGPENTIVIADQPR
jgi:hypothetical protein